MRTFVKSRRLAKALQVALAARCESQNVVAKHLGITQGQVSRLLSGQFKTPNPLVKKICKYARIDPDDYLLDTEQRSLNADVTDALTRVCGKNKEKTAIVMRVLRALEELECCR